MTQAAISLRPPATCAVNQMRELKALFQSENEERLKQNLVKYKLCNANVVDTLNLDLLKKVVRKAGIHEEPNFWRTHSTKQHLITALSRYFERKEGVFVRRDALNAAVGSMPAPPRSRTSKKAPLRPWRSILKPQSPLQVNWLKDTSDGLLYMSRHGHDEPSPADEAVDNEMGLKSKHKLRDVFSITDPSDDTDDEEGSNGELRPSTAEKNTRIKRSRECAEGLYRYSASSALHGSLSTVYHEAIVRLSGLDTLCELSGVDDIVTMRYTAATLHNLLCNPKICTEAIQTKPYVCKFVTNLLVKSKGIEEIQLCCGHILANVACLPNGDDVLLTHNCYEGLGYYLSQRSSQALEKSVWVLAIKVLAWAHLRGGPLHENVIPATNSFIHDWYEKRLTEDGNEVERYSPTGEHEGENRETISHTEGGYKPEAIDVEGIVRRPSTTPAQIVLASTNNGLGEATVADILRKLTILPSTCTRLLNSDVLESVLLLLSSSDEVVKMYAMECFRNFSRDPVTMLRKFLAHEKRNILLLYRGCFGYSSNLASDNSVESGSSCETRNEYRRRFSILRMLADTVVRLLQTSTDSLGLEFCTSSLILLVGLCRKKHKYDAARVLFAASVIPEFALLFESRNSNLFLVKFLRDQSTVGVALKTLCNVLASGITGQRLSAKHGDVYIETLVHKSGIFKNTDSNNRGVFVLALQNLCHTCHRNLKRLVLAGIPLFLVETFEGLEFDAKLAGVVVFCKLFEDVDARNTLPPHLRLRILRMMSRTFHEGSRMDLNALRNVANIFLFATQDVNIVQDVSTDEACMKLIYFFVRFGLHNDKIEMTRSGVGILCHLGERILLSKEVESYMLLVLELEDAISMARAALMLCKVVYASSDVHLSISSELITRLLRVLYSAKKSIEMEVNILKIFVAVFRQPNALDFVSISDLTEFVIFCEIRMTHNESLRLSVSVLHNFLCEEKHRAHGECAGVARFLCHLLYSRKVDTETKQNCANVLSNLARDPTFALHFNKSLCRKLAKPLDENNATPRRLPDSPGLLNSKKSHTLDVLVNAPEPLVFAWIETVASICMKSRSCAQQVVEGGIFESMASLLSFPSRSVQTHALHIYDIAASLGVAEARQEMVRRDVQVETLADLCRNGCPEIEKSCLLVLYKLSTEYDSARSINRVRVLRNALTDVFDPHKPVQLTLLAIQTLSNLASVCVEQLDVSFITDIMASGFIPKVFAYLNTDRSLVARLAPSLLAFFSNFHLLLPPSFDIINRFINAGLITLLSDVTGALSIDGEICLKETCILNLYCCCPILFKKEYYAFLQRVVLLLGRLCKACEDEQSAEALAVCLKSLVINAKEMPTITKLHAFQTLVIELARIGVKDEKVAGLLSDAFDVLKSSRATMNLPQSAVKALMKCNALSEVDRWKFQGQEGFAADTQAIENIKDLICDFKGNNSTGQVDVGLENVNNPQLKLSATDSLESSERLVEGDQAEKEAMLLFQAKTLLNSAVAPNMWIDEAILSTPIGAPPSPEPWKSTSAARYDADVFSEVTSESCSTFPIDSVERTWTTIDGGALNKVLKDSLSAPFKFMTTQVILAPLHDKFK